MRMVFDDNDRSVPDEMRDYALKKLGRIENWPEECADLCIALSVDGFNPLYKTELTWRIDSNVYRVEIAAAEMYTSIDLAATQVRVQLRKWSCKSRGRTHDEAVNRIKAYQMDEAMIDGSSLRQ